MFAWITSLCSGYKREYLNIDEGKAHDLARRITSISNERFKVQSESLGFTPKESTSL